MDINAATDQFVAQYNGKHIDEDGYYGAQCWDLVARFAREKVGCPSFPTGSGGAEGLFRIFAAPIPQYFDKVAASDARKGDIAVFPASFSPPWGHTALIVSRNGNTLQVFEQNGNNPGGNAYLTTRYVSQLSGVLRAKGADMSKTDIGIGRILTHAILGRNGSDGTVNALGGGTDGDINKYHVGVETNAEIWALYNSGEGKDWIWRRLPNLIGKAAQADAIGAKLTEANGNLAALQAQIVELGKRPTQEQLDALTKAAADANDAAVKANAELEKLHAQAAADQATGNAFLRWLGDQLNKILGKG